MRMIIKKEFIELLTQEDLKEHEDLYLISEASGIEVVKKILLAFSDGTEIIKKTSLKQIKPLVKRYIHLHSNSKSDKEIAKDLNVSENYIYKLRTNYKY